MQEPCVCVHMYGASMVLLAGKYSMCVVTCSAHAHAFVVTQLVYNCYHVCARTGAQAAPVLGGLGGGSGGGDGATVIPRSAWLARPNRVVQPKESFWIFTEVGELRYQCSSAL